MPADTRGTDLNTWWTNRAQYRREGHQAIASLREAHDRLVDAAPDTKTTTTKLLDGDTAATLVQKANVAVASLATAQAQFPKLNATLESERGLYNSVNTQVRAAAEQRARQRAEIAARNALHARQQWLVKQQKTRKIVAAVIFAVVLYILIQY